MELQQAIKEQCRLAVAVARNHERLAAEVYIIPGGVVFLDVGWSEPMASSFRAHFMAGEVEGSGPWRVVDWIIREVDPETDPEYVSEWERWLAWRAETGGTRERGARYATAILEMDVSSDS